MAENQSPNTNSSDEIDLGQLFKLIGSGLNKIGIAFLRGFLYLKKNFLILLGLVIVGLVAGYFLNQIVSKKLKTEVIVKPNLESKDYLYDVVAEIQAKLKANDTAFFESINVDIPDLKGLKIEIAKVDGDNSSESDIKFLELLQSFENTDAISDIVRAELENKSSYSHRITFYYKDTYKGQKFANGVINYINTNGYFLGLVKTFRKNAEDRIENNNRLLKQVDELINNYSKKMARPDNLVGNERIVLDNQEKINITGLFDLKNSLIRDIESKKMDLEETTDAIKVINFGQPQEVQKSFFGKSLILLPTLFLGGFFIISFIAYLNKKAIEIQ